MRGPELLGASGIQPGVPDERPEQPLLLGPHRLGRGDGEVVLVEGEVLLPADRDRHGAGRPAVEALLDGPDPPGAHHLEQPGVVEDRDVVRDRPPGAAGGLRELGHGCRPLGEQPEDGRAQRVREGAHLDSPG